MREIKDEPELPSVIGLGSYMLNVKPSVKFFFMFFGYNTDQSRNRSVLRGVFYNDDMRTAHL